MPRTDGKSQGVREAWAAAKDRVRAVQRAVEPELENGPYVTNTRHGVVRIEAAEFHKDGELEWVDVRVGGEPSGGDPHYVIYNPPVLVEDPSGEIERDGRRYRRDPAQALAEVIAMNGGAEAPRKARGRRTAA